jgi:hypothetical protein
MDKKSMAIKYISYLENPINLIQDCFQTFDATQEKFVDFDLFPKQAQLIQKYQTGKHIVVNKSRQAGVSTLTAAYIAAICALTTKDNPYKVIIVANKGNQAQDFLLKIKDFLAQVPRWVWGPYYDDTKDLDGHIIGKGSVKAIRLKNGCHISAVATSKDAIRGASSPRIIVIDEAAHIDKTDGELMYGSAMMALSSNVSGQMFLISTPMGTDPIFFKTYSETIATNGDNKFTIHEMYFFEDPRYNKNLIWKFKHKDGQIEIQKEIEFDNEKMVQKFQKGWMPESDWYKEQCAILHNDKRLINQELLCKFDGSGNNVVEFEHIKRHEEEYVCDPIEKLEEKGNLWLWSYPQEGHVYTAFVDVSSGSSDDFSSLEILDLTTGEQVVEYKGKLKPELFAPIVKRWCEMYNALTDVDTTGGYGDNLISSLQLLNFKLLRLDEKGEVVGIKFSGSNRPKIIQRFVEYVESDSIKIRSIRLISELKTFVWINNRPDHLRGFNDDAIIATAGCIWLYENYFKVIQAAKAQSKNMLNAWLTSLDTPKKEQQTPSNPNVKSVLQKKERQNADVRITQNGVDISAFAWLIQ